MIDSGNGILPDQILNRRFRPQIAGTRPHVAMGELEPGPGEGIFKGFRVIKEMFYDLAIGRIHLKRQVRGRHHGRMPYFGVMGVLHGVLGSRVRGRPLIGTGRALGQFPIILKERFQVPHIPSGWFGLPGAFGTAADCMPGFSAAKLAFPAEPHLLDGGSFGLWPDQRRIARTMALTKSMPACNQCNGFLIIHRHPGEGLTHINGRCHGIRYPVWPFRINIDQTHLHCRQGIFKISLTGIALIAKPFIL